jgi:hypothetical protein
VICEVGTNVGATFISNCYLYVVVSYANLCHSNAILVAYLSSHRIFDVYCYLFNAIISAVLW